MHIVPFGETEDNNRRGDVWEQFIVSKGLYLLNDDDAPTFSNHLGESNIDIALTNAPGIVGNWVNTRTFHGSDHALIMASNYTENPNVDKYVQNIARTDWNIFINALPPMGDFHANNTAELSLRADLMLKNIQYAFNVACPPKRAFPGKPCKWWTRELTVLLRKKNLAARNARRWAGTNRGVRANMAKKALFKLFQKTLRIAKSESWKNFTSNLEGYRNISSLFKSLKNNQSNNIPFLYKPDGTPAVSLRENLQTLRVAHFGNSTDSYEVNTGSETVTSRPLSAELDEFLDIRLLDRAIASLPNGKAPGPDGIRNELLSRLPQCYRIELLKQFRASISMAFIPPAWLKISAVYISKGGNRAQSDPKAYRPIGLSSTVLKLCERLINWRIKNTVIPNGIPKQHAFTLGMSTETAISELVSFPRESQNER